MLRDAYATYGVERSKGKETERCSHGKRKGLFVDGLAGRASIAVDKLLMHLALTAWVLLQPSCKLKWLQGVVGRWVSDFIVRRPAFACFDQ
eukprot:922400-Heterocapsa_arctica.AAC.1